MIIEKTLVYFILFDFVILLSELDCGMVLDPNFTGKFYTWCHEVGRRKLDYWEEYVG